MVERLLIFVLLFFCSVDAYSQSETGMYSLDFVPQVTYFNPAVRPKTKFHLGFSSPVQLITPFAYSDIFYKKNGSTVIVNGKQFYDNLKPSSYFSTETSPDISFGFALFKRSYMMFGIREVAQSGFKLSKNFFDLVINGNADNRLNEKNIGDFNVGGSHYREFSGGMSYDINCKWSVGGKIKYLTGYQNVITKKADVTFNTDTGNYNIAVDGNYQLLTSGMSSEALDDFRRNPFAFNDNWGLGLDMGVLYKINDKFRFSASVLDLGFIKWNSNNQIIENTADAQFNFTGLSFKDYDNDGISYLQTVIDSIVKEFNAQTINTDNTFTTSLKSRAYLNFEYRPLNYLTAGLTFNIYARYRDFYPVVTAYTNFTLKKLLQFQLNYSITRANFFNLGAGAVFNLGPIQIFTASDNIYGALFNPKDAKEFNFRFGMNFQWSYGKQKTICEKEDNLKYRIDTTMVPIEDTVYITDTLQEENLPEAKYLINDMDGDGIVDTLDLCPQTQGEWKYKGCPSKKVMNQRIKYREKYKTKTPSTTIENPPADIDNEKYPTPSYPKNPLPDNQTPNIKFPGESTPGGIFRNDQFKPRIPSPSPSPSRAPRIY